MKLLILCVSALCCSAVSAQRDVRGDTTTTGRYSVYKANNYWDTYYKHCRDTSSHLAVIESQEEADNLETLMKIYDVQAIHVGLSDKYQAGRYVSILDQDLDTIGYNTWRVGYPNITRGNCVGFSRAGGEVGLFNYNCTSWNTISAAICEERRWDDYTLIPGHGYYSWYSQRRSWPEARRVCRQQGAHLIILNSSEELQAVYKMTGFPGQIWLFVGITDKRHTGVQASLFNTPVAETGFNQWQSVPANSTTKPWVAVFAPIFMASEPDDQTFMYVCEHPLVTA